MEIERLKLEREGKVNEDHMQIKYQELKRLREKDQEEKERLNSAVYKAKLFGDALKGTIARMPSNQIDLIPYFRQVEQLFADFGVEAKLRAHLLRPHMSEQARSLVSRMDPVKASDYEEVKKLLLREFKLSSSALLEKFNSLKREGNETFTLFGNRMKSVLMYYTESRKVNDYNSLLDLLVCDRLKSQLSESALRHILSLENQVDQGWLKLDKLVSALDVFYNTHCESGEPRVVGSATTDSTKQRSFARLTPQKFGNSKIGTQSPRAGINVGNDQRKSCFVCGSKNHLKNYHDKHPAPSAKLQACFASKCELGANQSVDVTSGVIDEHRLTSVSVSSVSPYQSVKSESSNDVTTTTKTNVAEVKELVIDRDQSVLGKSFEHNFEARLESSESVAKVVEHDFATLQYIDVCLGDGKNVCHASVLCDSGAEYIVMSFRRSAGIIEVHKIGSGVIGQSIEADVIRLNVKLDSAFDKGFIPITMAMSPHVNDPLICQRK